VVYRGDSNLQRVERDIYREQSLAYIYKISHLSLVYYLSIRSNRLEIVPGEKAKVGKIEDCKEFILKSKENNKRGKAKSKPPEITKRKNRENYRKKG
jgi:hypothetical protein